MNIVVCGHVDHGKSTLIGRLLYDSQQIADSKVSEVQKLANEMKKKFEFAYFIDAFRDEINEERTIDTTSLRFRSPKRVYTVTDVPGHKEFIKNMLTGASKADAAILVVAQDKGIQEQTRRHLFLISLLGIGNVIIFINKLDLVNFDSRVVNRIQNEVLKLISKYKFTYTTFIPGSALTGENVYKKSDGNIPTLVEALDGLKEQEQERPTRVVIQGIYKDKILARVVSGSFAGYSKGKCFTYGGLTDVERRGDVIGGQIVKEFEAQITILQGSLRVGERFDIKCGTKKVQAKITNVYTTMSSETGEVVGENPNKIGRAHV